MLCWLQVTSGRGPDECSWVVARVAEAMVREASAVRVIHVPTGIQAIAQEERSQHRNRRLALSRLLEKLNQQNQAAQSKLRQNVWDGHNELERGNPVRVYEGTKFKLKRITQRGVSAPQRHL